MSNLAEKETYIQQEAKYFRGRIHTRVKDLREKIALIRNVLEDMETELYQLTVYVDIEAAPVLVSGREEGI